MHLVLLFACADPAAEQEILELRQQVATLEEQVTDLQGQLERQKTDRQARMDELRERMELRRQRRGNDDGGTAEDDGGTPDGPTTLRQAMENPENASRMARFLLHRDEGGSFDGYRLSAVRRGTLLDNLGLKNGDIVHSVSGHRLDSMSAAMEAYTALKDVSEVEVELSRRGQKMKLTVPVDTAPVGAPPSGDAAE